MSLDGDVVLLSVVIIIILLLIIRVYYCMLFTDTGIRMDVYFLIWVLCLYL